VGEAQLVAELRWGAELRWEVVPRRAVAEAAARRLGAVAAT
jgi:hypothetical protein